MRTEVVGKHFDISDGIREYADKRTAKLTKYYDGVQEIIVVLESDKLGKHFEAEIKVESEKHDTFVAKHDGHDVYECIDQCVEKMSRQLTDFKEKLKNTKR